MAMEPENQEVMTEERPAEQPATMNLTPGQTADLIDNAVGKLRIGWLQSAVTVAKFLQSGQHVSRGIFEDVRNLRENYEEMERARLFLKKMSSPEAAASDDK